MISEAPFCSACWSGIYRYSGPACQRCFNPIVSPFGRVCSDCMKDPPAYTRAISFGLYEGTLANAINLFKFSGIRRLYRPLAELLLRLDVPDADAVVPVPLGSNALRERGYNQALLLSMVVSEKRKRPLIIDGLKKVSETKPQIGLSARERRLNLKGAFIADRSFEGKRLLLIDDVMTTGATVRECAGRLLKAGAAEVSVLTLARARVD